MMSETSTPQSVSRKTDSRGDRHGVDAAPESHLQPLPDLADYAKAYARQRPATAALWCFGIGFVLGWRLKPW